MDSISLRDHLQGKIVEFLKKEDMSCLITQQGIIELINAIALYKEEGKNLFPEIFIIDDLQIFQNVLKPFTSYKIDSGEKSAETMFTALKKCAPLTEGNSWSIYILRRNDSFEYGIFRYGEHILSIDASKILMEDVENNPHIINIRQLTEKTVMVSGTITVPLIINFGINPAGDLSFLDNKTDFIKLIINGVNNIYKDQTENFFSRVFNDVLQKSHGILAVVIDHKKKEVPKFLSDGIKLTEKIDTQSYISQLITKNDLTSSFSLEGCASLISGMLLSDGITVFDTQGNIRAYNVFIKFPRRNIKEISGGARERTFEYLCTKINNGIIAAFFQSQDGKTKFKGK